MNGSADQLRLLEALLFAAPAPLSEAELAERIGLEADVPGLLQELSANYAERGVHVVRLAGGWTFRTAPDLAPFLVSERPVTRKLSRAAVETLAIVAYHQPVTRAEIEAIRGVAVAHGTLDRLMETGWVRPKGRRDSPGRPRTWGTTPAFLAQFGLDSVNDLPGIDELRADGFWLRQARTLSREFQSSVDQMIRDAELDEMRQELKKATEFDIEKEIHKTVDPTGELTESIKPPDIPDFFETAPASGSAEP